MSVDGVSTMSESIHSTQAVEGPMVVKRSELRARDMAARRTFWFSSLCRGVSSWALGTSKSCRRMVTLAKRLAL